MSQRFTLDVRALVSRIEADIEQGWLPLIVVGTAGTTGAGLIDPLPQLAETARQFGLWFHVDAAWGGSAALSSRLRSAIRGVEQADSVTWDAHKWLSVPMGAGMFFCRHPEAVKRAFAISTSYMPQDSGHQAVDPYVATAQWSRRLTGLKVFMALGEFARVPEATLRQYAAALKKLETPALEYLVMYTSAASRPATRIAACSAAFFTVTVPALSERQEVDAGSE